MACTLQIQPRLFSSLLCDHLPLSTKPLGQLLSYTPSAKRALVRSSRTLCNLADLIFNGRNSELSSNSQRKRLRPGKVSPCLHVPDHIPKPPYVMYRQSPGISSGHEIHDVGGIECMRPSGRLAAQVLEYAGTLVKD